MSWCRLYGTSFLMMTSCTHMSMEMSLSVQMVWRDGSTHISSHTQWITLKSMCLFRLNGFTDPLLDWQGYPGQYQVLGHPAVPPVLYWERPGLHDGHQGRCTAPCSNSYWYHNQTRQSWDCTQTNISAWLRSWWQTDRQSVGNAELRPYKSTCLIFLIHSYAYILS